MSNEIVTQETGVAIPESWRAKLAGYAQQNAATEVPTGQFFSTKSGVLSFAQQPLRDNTMDVLVIGSIHENVYYPEAFSGSNLLPPLCYSFGGDDATMVPHGEVTTAQSANCAGCAHNAWNSGAGGKGKACKNQRRLAVMPTSALADAEGVAKATVGYLRVPVTSVKLWSAYTQLLASRGFPAWAAVTRIKLVPDPKSMQKLTFDFVRVVTDDALLSALENRSLIESRAIAFPYAKRPDPNSVGAAAAGPAVSTKF